jgi:mRNA-degrading endonuclease toxin of MazEF toxin-antitoxin module
MKQWDIFDYEFRHPIGLHPAVLLTPDAILANPDWHEINVLIVTTVRAGYQPRPLDVMLNGADGLNHLSRARVHPIYEIDKRDLRGFRGTLSSVRQKALAGKIREIYRLG